MVLLSFVSYSLITDVAPNIVVVLAAVVVVVLIAAVGSGVGDVSVGDDVYSATFDEGDDVATAAITNAAAAADNDDDTQTYIHMHAFTLVMHIYLCELVLPRPM